MQCIDAGNDALALVSRVWQEGVYRYERHPAYLGAMIWGIGIQACLGLDKLNA